MKKIVNYLTLTKPRITVGILLTTAAGFYIGSDAIFNVNDFLNCLIGTSLIVSSTNAFNMILEKKSDATMNRTKERPLPSGKVGLTEATVFSLVLLILGLIFLFFFVNSISAILALFASMVYIFLYTLLKQKTFLSVFFGLIAGAIPPLIGYTSATNTVTFNGFLLFIIQFVWQILHIYSLTLLYSEDYKRAGFKIAPANPFNQKFTFFIFSIVVSLLIISTLPAHLKIPGLYYLILSIILGCLYILVLFLLFKNKNIQLIRFSFKYSMIYIFSLFLSMCLNKL